MVFIDRDLDAIKVCNEAKFKQAITLDFINKQLTLFG